MPRRRRVPKGRLAIDEDAVRAFLLHPAEHDYFNEMRSLGADAVATYWREHRAALLDEFTTTHVCDARCAFRPGDCRPRGFHLFEAVA